MSGTDAGGAWVQCAMHRVLKIPGGGGAGCPYKLADPEQEAKDRNRKRQPVLFPGTSGRGWRGNTVEAISRMGLFTGIGRGNGRPVSTVAYCIEKVRLLGQAGLLFLIVGACRWGV